MRLNNLAILNIHEDLAKVLMDDSDELLNEFISKNNYRASTFSIVKKINICNKNIFVYVRDNFMNYQGSGRRGVYKKFPHLETKRLACPL